MANLSTLIQTKKAVAQTIADNFSESNLESGRIYLYSGGEITGTSCCFCWKSERMSKALEAAKLAGFDDIMICASNVHLGV